MVGLELCVRPELLRDFLGNLDERIHISVFHIYYHNPNVRRLSEGLLQRSGASARGWIGLTY